MKTHTAVFCAFIAALISANSIAYGFHDPSTPVLGPFSSVLSAFLLGHVSNNTALSTLPARLGRVQRDGFATAGDGGEAEFTLSATACSAPDGGSQVALTAGGCARIDAATLLVPGIFGNDFQALATAAIGLNRSIFVPCGTYLVAPLSIVIPNLATFSMHGASRECVVLNFRGNGLALRWSGIGARADIEDVTFATSDTSGQFDALVFQQSIINPNPALSPTNEIARVSFRGTPGLGGGPSPYWRSGFIDTGVSNINIDNVTFNSSGSFQGNGIVIQGYKPDKNNVANDGYVVSINIVDYISFGCASGITRGDFVQGLTVINGQATGCHFGIAIPGGAIGINDQIHVHGGQWADDKVGILCADANTAHMIVESGYYITVGTATAIQSCGETPIITHNIIGGNASQGSIGIAIDSPSVGNNALISHNAIRGLGIAIKEASNIQTPVLIIDNQISDTAKDYVIDPSDSHVLILDQKPQSAAALRSAVPCNTSIYGSRFVITDGKKPTFMRPVVGGGKTIVPVICDSSSGDYVAY